MSNSDRRVEPRVPSQGTGQLTVSDMPGGAKGTVTIIDVSRSGVQIELDEALEVTIGVEVQLRNMTLLGSVEYCRLHDNGRYRVGILTAQVIEAASS